MKRSFFLNSVFTIFALLITVSGVKAQDADKPVETYTTDSPSLYVVVQRSDMCTMCADNYDRWNKEIVDYYSGRPSIVFMNYDITNEKTIEGSRADIDKYELYEILNANNRPGRVFLVDPANKQILRMLDIDRTTVDFRNEINTAAPLRTKSESK